MTDKELRDAALVALGRASGHFMQTTKGYKQMAKPLPTTSQWGQGYVDFDEALGLLAQIGHQPPPPPPPPPPPTDTLIGVYTGGLNVDGVTSFGTWLGRPMDLAVEFTSDKTWETIESLSGFSAWWKGKYRLILGVPCWPGSSGSLAQGAAGAYDAHYAKLAENLKSRGMVDTIIRFGWEFGGGWYPWGVKSATDAANYAGMFRHASDAMKGVCPTLKMDWNGILAPSIDPALAYPGDTYVDYSTFDHYDSNWLTGGMTPDEAWTHWRTMKWGINWWQDFADDHGKPWGVPEWGLVNTAGQSGHGNGDNPAFIDQMADLFMEEGCAYQAYFNYSPNGQKHSLDLFPQGKARFKARFA